MEQGKGFPSNEYCEVQFKVGIAGMHCWPEATGGFAYLANPHRHLFVIRGGYQTTKDRQIEFIALGQLAEATVRTHWERRGDQVQFGSTSCEDIAKFVMSRLNLQWCSVHEDDENGALVRRVT